MTDSRHIYYRTITNLVHPAVLGTIIVNLIASIINGTLFRFGFFPFLASCILVWYFVIDYWVTMISFEENPSQYRLTYFLLDILTLFVLFGSFYSLWTIHNDVLFFVTIVLLILLVGLWSVLLTGRFEIRDPVYRIQLIVFLSGIAPLISASLLQQFHDIVKYSSLIIISICLVFYTKVTLS